MEDDESESFAVLVLSLWHEDDVEGRPRVRITRRKLERSETVVASTTGEVLEIVRCWLDGPRSGPAHLE